jgi:hypothetical protein
MTEHAVLVSPKILAVHLGRDAYVYVRQVHPHSGPGTH